jgi:hypothetical protein
MQLLVVLVLADTFERDFNDYADDLRDFIANGKIKKTGHLPLSLIPQGQMKRPLRLRDSSAVPFRTAPEGGFVQTILRRARKQSIRTFPESVQQGA